LKTIWRARPAPFDFKQNESEPVSEAEPPSYLDLEHDDGIEAPDRLRATRTPKPPSDWQLFWIGLWKWAFHVPMRPGAWEPPAEYDAAAEERLIEASRQLQEKVMAYEKYDQLENLHEIDICLISMFDHEFTAGPYTMRFFRWVRHSRTSLGTYESLTNDTLMLFTGGDWCSQARRRRETSIHIARSSESKLVEVNETATCKYSGVFATPAACNPDVINDLKSGSLEDLKTVADELDLERTIP
jgi:hypothetical protein